MRVARPIPSAAKATTIIDHIDYWTYECLIDELFLQLAGRKEVVSHNGKNVTVYKYYHQAMILRRYIAVADPENRPSFIVNLSDLTPRIISELKAIDDIQLVLRQAVGHIFQNIDFRLYHLSVAKV